MKPLHIQDESFNDLFSIELNGDIVLRGIVIANDRELAEYLLPSSEPQQVDVSVSSSNRSTLLMIGVAILAFFILIILMILTFRSTHNYKEICRDNGGVPVNAGRNNIYNCWSNETGKYIDIK